MTEEKQIIEEMARVLCEDCERDVAPCSLSKLGRMCDAVREQAEALYNAGYRKQEWISVEDRLPEDDGSTILYYDGEEVDACYFFFGTFNTMDTYDSSEICGVTHWMPLPEAPKMKGGAE